MFGWCKWIEQQAEKKRQQEKKDAEKYSEMIANYQRFMDEVFGEYRNKKKENITKESFGQAHLSPFQKSELLKQSRISSIAGVTEEPWMHLNLFDRKKEKELMGLMTVNGTNLERAAEDYKNLYDELMEANKVKEYKYISRNRPELGLGVIYTEQNELIGLVEYEMDLDELESFTREDVEQFYDLDKFFEIPDSVTNMSDFFKWALGEKK